MKNLILIALITGALATGCGKDEKDSQEFSVENASCEEIEARIDQWEDQFLKKRNEFLTLTDDDSRVRIAEELIPMCEKFLSEFPDQYFHCETEDGKKKSVEIEHHQMIKQFVGMKDQIKKAREEIDRRKSLQNGNKGAEDAHAKKRPEEPVKKTKPEKPVAKPEPRKPNPKPGDIKKSMQIGAGHGETDTDGNGFDFEYYRKMVQDTNDLWSISIIVMSIEASVLEAEAATEDFEVKASIREEAVRIYRFILEQFDEGHGRFRFGRAQKEAFERNLSGHLKMQELWVDRMLDKGKKKEDEFFNLDF